MVVQHGDEYHYAESAKIIPKNQATNGETTVIEKPLNLEDLKKP